MKLDEAIKEAQLFADKYDINMTVVEEGLHADEFAELPSYGFCPSTHVKILYPYGKFVKDVTSSL